MLFKEANFCWIFTQIHRINIHTAIKVGQNRQIFEQRNFNRQSLIAGCWFSNVSCEY